MKIFLNFKKKQVYSEIEEKLQQPLL